MSEFTAALHRFDSVLDYPMFVVTATNGRERSGCLVGFASQCSIHPPRWWVWLSKKNHTYAVARDAAVLVVHSLAARQIDLARLFGGETGDEVDKFTRCAWHVGPDGRTPVLDDCPRWFAGRILDRMDSGDHTGFLLEPFDAACENEEPPLGFQTARGIAPGHAP